MSAQRVRLGLLVALIAVLVVLGSAWALRRTADDAERSLTVGAPTEPARSAEPAPLSSPVTRIATGGSAPGALAIVGRAHTAVLSASGPDRLRAAYLAHTLRAPLVVARAGDAPAAAATPSERTGGAAAAALRRLGVVRAVVVGDIAHIARDADVRQIVRLRPATQRHPSGRQLIRWVAGGPAPGPRHEPGFDPTVVRDLLATRPAAPAGTGVVALVRPRGTGSLHVALAADAVGHTVAATSASDLRTDTGLIERLSAMPTDGRRPQVIVGGRGMATLDRRAVAAQVAVVATGTQLPGGGQVVVDPSRPRARRYVGLYGVPHSSALGALGEQPVAASVARARRLADDYQRAAGHEVDVIGCFEIIATVASRSAGPDRNYANELSIAQLEPAVRAARRAGLYVLLDIQPGRSDLLIQARRYRRLLRLPHVGLALDPEWRLGPRERHLEQIGSVGVDEINGVARWLADLTRRNRLPQKMLLIHQFRLSMVRDRERLDTGRSELAYVIQMDGQGPQGSKMETWRAITARPPAGVQFGWKHFYDEDTPVRTPEATMALTPAPVFVSYQ